MGVDVHQQSSTVQGKYVDKMNLNTGGQPMLGGGKKRGRVGVRVGIYSGRSKGSTRPLGFLVDTRRYSINKIQDNRDDIWEDSQRGE
jgi:hypothetical protein